MDWAFVGDLQQLGPLLIRQRSCKVNVTFDSIEHSFLGLALGAISSVNLRVSQMDRNFLERPRLAASVHPYCHRRTRPQSGE
jgi:hypothetical protein